MYTLLVQSIPLFYLIVGYPAILIHPHYIQLIWLVVYLPL